jgi:PmbA protein
MAVEDVVLRASELVRSIRARDARLALDQFELESVAGSHALVATTGAEAAESDAVCSASVFGMAVEGDDVGGFHYTGDVGRTLADFERRIAAANDDFVTTALGNLGAGRAETYQGPVWFSPEAFLSVFVSPVVGGASAIAVQRGRSALGGKLGTQIASPLVSIHDDPGDVTLAGAGRFDREGQPTRRFALVEDGVLKGFLYNAYAAAVDGTRSTGHASGGARSLPGLGTHAVVVAPGTTPRAELVRTLGRGLWVQRFSGTVDPASGDFSGVAKSARWIEPDGSQRPVRETLLSGNAFALLPRVLGLSSEQKRCSGSSLAPWALVDGVSVTAG